MLAYKNRKEGGAARTKLVFNSHQTVAEKGGGKEHANMIIDSEGLVYQEGKLLNRN